ncbi:MAG: carbohydrate-binding domain-containing protein [Clostridiales Family XIII bacterium]|nr:carbohydrate-binding domain-containing protein [Clostridiales Family XIII bacterium]
MKKKTKTRALCAILLSAALLQGCASEDTAELPPREASAEAGAEALTYGYDDADLDAAWDESAAVRIALRGDTAAADGDGAAFSDGVVTISEAGTYVLAGELNDGRIRVDAGKEDLVRLVLNGVSLRSESGAAIYAKQAGKTVITLAEGTENTIADAAVYADEGDADAPDAAVFVQDSLTINGTGALSVTGNAGNAVDAKDMLVVTGGRISVSAKKDGLRGRDGVAIRDGSFAIRADDDGIKSNNADDAAKGFILLEGGTYDIEAGHDAVQAESDLAVRGGTFDIVTGGGAEASAEAPADASAAQTDSAEAPADASAAQTDSAEAAAEDASDSMKAYKAGKSLTIEGGAFTVDAADDAFHASEIRVVDGSFSVRTGDDAFHADGALRIDGGDMDIAACYEGLEGGTVDINGGDIFIDADDDAINAAGGSDEAEQRGPARRDRFNAADGAYYVRITGGRIDALGGNDGIDANGDIHLEGGSLFLSARSSGTEGAVDLDGRFIVTGGTLIAAGSVATPAEGSTQAVLLVSHTAWHAAGSVLSLLDEAGNVILEYATRMEYGASAMSAPGMERGRGYTLCVDGEKLTDIELRDVVTAVSDDGGDYALGGGGRGGFAPPAGGNRPTPGEGEGFGPPQDGTGTAPQDGEGFAPPAGGSRPAPGEGEGFGPPQGGALPTPPAAEDAPAP